MFNGCVINKLIPEAATHNIFPSSYNKKLKYINDVGFIIVPTMIAYDKKPLGVGLEPTTRHQRWRPLYQLSYPRFVLGVSRAKVLQVGHLRC